MRDDRDHLDELPDGLHDIVAGLVAEPVPTELKDSVRSRLNGPVEMRPIRRTPQSRMFVAVAASTVAAVVAAVVLTPAASTSRRNTGFSASEAIASGREVGPGSTRGPSLWTYHRAAGESPDRLDGLLAEHAGTILACGRDVAGRATTHPSRRLLEEL